MKQITIEIPDEKFSFVSELLKNLGFSVQVHVSDIPEDQKELVRERIKSAKPQDYITINELEKKLKLD